MNQLSTSDIIRQARNGMYPRGHVFLAHEPCPKCRKEGKDVAGNNMGRWEDGHTFCFAGHGVINNSDAITLLKSVADKEAKEIAHEKKKGTYLPDDAKWPIGYKGMAWLARYDISRDEIGENEILWSDMRDQLIFPYRDTKGNLLAWQGRSFREPIGQAYTKWWNAGELDDLTHIIEKDEHAVGTLCLVEDIVSAIKVGRHIRTMPLFGSNLSIRRALRLRYLTNNVIFWLDQDKFKESMGFSKQLQIQGLDTRIIYTESDPKVYDDEHIKDFLRS